MHEHHVVEGIVKQILEKAKTSRAQKITKVILVMGELCGFDEGSVRIYFENFAHGTQLEGAELIINSQPAQLKCNTCDMVFNRKKGSFDCPHCGNLGVAAQGGKDFYIDSIEIES